MLAAFKELISVMMVLFIALLAAAIEFHDPLGTAVSVLLGVVSTVSSIYRTGAEHLIQTSRWVLLTGGRFCC